jgi:hypothetical protein
MKTMKARVRVAIVAILPERVIYWKKISRLIKPKTQRGRNIETKFAPGYL